MRDTIQPPSSLQTETKRILIVDDDPTTRMLLERLLSQQGYVVQQAEDGLQGVEKFHQQRPHLVILDVSMPRMDGFQACRHMRERDPNGLAHIMMLTARDDVDAIEASFQAGANDFSTKPIQPLLLAQRLRFALRAQETYREVRLHRRRQRQAQKLAKVGYWEWNTDTDQVHFSSEVFEILGFSRETLGASMQSYLRLVHPDDRPQVVSTLELLRQTRQEARIEHRLLLHGDQECTVLALAAPHPDAYADHDTFFGTLQDITELREAEAQLEFQRYHDLLTGLPNRRLFQRQLEELLHSSGENPDPVAVISLDLDRFHLINESLGNGQGDMVLRTVAQRLQESNEGGLVARMQGDQFILALAVDIDTAVSRLQQLTRRIGELIDLAGHALYLESSAGVAVYPQDATSPEGLINAAEKARMTAKSQGGGNFGFFSDEMSTQANQRLRLESELHQALPKRQLVLHFQPQMQVRERRLVGVEALVRWQHPEAGLMQPGDFIPLVEQSGLILEFGNWILEEAVRQAAEWQRRNIDLRVGVNLSGRQFMQADLVETVQQLLEKYRLRPDRLDLEITESVAMSHAETNIRTLRRLKELGVSIAIDDFGTGYSSLEYLQRFPLDILKIDRAFITHLADKSSDRAIAHAIIAMAKSLGLGIIAEGVEQAGQLALLGAMGCDEIQGFLVGKPMPAGQIESLVRKQADSLAVPD